ncbi:hypothetical protein CPB84DRAFT_1852653 [Gymnopilus junonius]|uniref:Uncharacterized protein n=1 Tax=Gymnopilus junonius TaxID=109634 RepID=A0A9P5THN7_GYMJU|nr:hypothetical protein CPB84DRAFT_1852653 [Gymnopilus junonius]
MAHTHDIPLVTQKAAAKTARKGQQSPEAGTINVAEVEQPAAGKKDNSGEEFLGYAAIDDSESESDGEAEDALTLKEANKALQQQLKALKAQVDGGKKKGKGGKKTSQKVTFASRLLPDWNEEANSIKEPAKKQTHAQISASGLEDSDAEAINPFPLPSKPGPHTLTEEELTKGFAEEKWQGTFLLMLYDKFFASDKPFDAFYVGSDEFVTLLQDVIEEVYPEVKYKVTSSDAIHFLAYNRINEKRSNISSSAIELVKKHLGTLKGEQAAKDWLRWALHVTDGPLFFKEPSPMGSPVDQKDLAYQFPGGCLLTPFVIGLAAPLLSLRVGSASNNGYPKGLIALIMGVLERAI